MLEEGPRSWYASARISSRFWKPSDELDVYHKRLVTLSRSSVIIAKHGVNSNVIRSPERSSEPARTPDIRGTRNIVTRMNHQNAYKIAKPEKSVPRTSSSSFKS